MLGPNKHVDLNQQHFDDESAEGVQQELEFLVPRTAEVSPFVGNPFSAQRIIPCCMFTTLS